jgi:hypothetical protein
MLRERLGRVHWAGGGSGARKSTIARRAAERHGLRPYATGCAMPIVPVAEHFGT